MRQLADVSHSHSHSTLHRTTPLTPSSTPSARASARCLSDPRPRSSSSSSRSCRSTVSFDHRHAHTLFPIPSPIPLGRHIDRHQQEGHQQPPTSAPGIREESEGEEHRQDTDAGERDSQEEDSGVITNGHLAGVFGGPHQRSSLRLRESKVGNCYAYRVERHYFHLIGANFRRATCPTFRSPTLALALALIRGAAFTSRRQ